MLLSLLLLGQNPLFSKKKKKMKPQNHIFRIEVEGYYRDERQFGYRGEGQCQRLIQTNYRRTAPIPPPALFLGAKTRKFPGSIFFPSEEGRKKRREEERKRKRKK
jgi:hypothetical protein